MRSELRVKDGSTEATRTAFPIPSYRRRRRAVRDEQLGEHNIARSIARAFSLAETPTLMMTESRYCVVQQQQKGDSPIARAAELTAERGACE